MNFDFTDREEGFRKEVRGWLEANLPDDLRGRAFAASRAGRDEVKKLRAWQKRMCEAGYVGLDWPREFGGRGGVIAVVQRPVVAGTLIAQAAIGGHAIGEIGA